MANKFTAALDALRSIARVANPAEEKTILKNIADNIDEMARQAKEFGGFTLNPRTGKFLEGTKDFGYMMATVPERTMNRAQPDDVLRLIADPYYMDRLRRGQYLGGWMDEGEFVLDPSQRFLNRNRSITRGAEARQKAGFDVANADVYDLTPEVVANARRVAEERAARQALALMLGLPAGAAAVGLGVRGATR